METKLCSCCNQEKSATFSHIGKNRAYIYKDDKGRWWKSQVCADCQAEKRRQARAYKAEKLAKGENPHTGSDFITIYVEDDGASE